jgi:outer membrane protein assembly factor BamB
MRKSTFFLLLFTSIFAHSTWAIDWPQWRGPDRSGTSTEKGLLQSWPAEGPKLLWEGGAIGEGFSSLAIKGDRIFTMGDKSGNSQLFCLQKSNGQTIWSIQIGKPGGNYSGTRCTPTVDEDSVYALGQFGDLVCVDAARGREKWRKNIQEEFRGESGGWNYSESVLIDGDLLLCSPGGNDATVVALNKNNGAVIWKTSLPGAGQAHYSSWVVSNAAGVKQYVRLYQGGTYGIEAKSGKYLWHYDVLGRNTANIPTPIPFDDYVFTAAGYGKGGALLKLARSGSGVSATEVYYNQELKNKHGGIIKVGNYIYGDMDDRGRPWCADIMTGKVLWRKDSGAGGGSACVTYGDGRLYFRYQDSTMALIDPDPEKGFQQISTFKIPDNMKQSWAHPVISEGKLYLRGNDKILCYDISDPSRKQASQNHSPRIWKDNSGNFQVEATFQSQQAGNVMLKKTDGTVIQVPIYRLSVEDRGYLQGL